MAKMVHVSDAAALAEIRRLAALGRVRITRHARDRMVDRGATMADVTAAATSATSATWQPDRSNWRVDGGRDTDGDALTLVVDIDADLIIITLF